MFSKKLAPPAPDAGRNLVAGPTFSILGADTAIRGDVVASADLHIDGRVEGDIACKSLVQGESSVIVGAVIAETARLSGTLHGTISARELVILKTARVEGDVHYDALTIEQGAQVDGRFSPRPAARSEPEGEGHLILASSQG